jgi:hypothetical protein
MTTTSVKQAGKAVGTGFLLEKAGLAVYIDPTDAPDGFPKADVVILSMVDPKKVPEREVRLLSTPQTIVAGLPQCVSRFRLNQLPLLVGQKKAALDVEVEVVSADDAAATLVLRFPGEELRWP